MTTNWWESVTPYYIVWRHTVDPRLQCPIDALLKAMHDLFGIDSYTHEINDFNVERLFKQRLEAETYHGDTISPSGDLRGYMRGHESLLWEPGRQLKTLGYLTRSAAKDLYAEIKVIESNNRFPKKILDEAWDISQWATGNIGGGLK
ncbi:MAG: hypothetical protein WBP49_10565 [Acidimicrobiia bacterium]